LIWNLLYRLNNQRPDLPAKNALGRKTVLTIATAKNGVKPARA
jgi:hypothetical protein